MSAGVLHIVFLSKFRKIHKKKSVSESLFNKVAGIRPATLLRDSGTVVLYKFCDIFKKTFYKKRLRVTISELGFRSSPL